MRAGLIDEVRVVVWRVAHAGMGRVGRAHRRHAVRVHRDAVGTGERPEIVIERTVLEHDEDQMVEVHDAGLRIDRPTGIVESCGRRGVEERRHVDPLRRQVGVRLRGFSRRAQDVLGLGIGRVRVRRGGAGRRRRRGGVGHARYRLPATGARHRHQRGEHQHRRRSGERARACGTLGPDHGARHATRRGAVRDFTGSGPARTDRSASPTSRTPSRGSRAPGPRGRSDGCPASPSCSRRDGGRSASDPRSTSGRRRS